MARRFALVLVPALVFLALALGLPLGLAVAERATQAEYLDRLAEAGVLADTAGPLLAEVVPPGGVPTAGDVGGDVGARLTAALGAETRREGVAARLVGPDGGTLLEPPGRPPPGTAGEDVEEQVRQRVVDAVAGRRPAPVPVSWPWGTEPLVVVDPVVVDGRAVGAVVLLAPTAALHDAVVRQWLLLAAAGAVPLAVGAAMTRPLARWLAAPIADLDRAAGAVTAGDLRARADEQVGPPEVRRLATSFNAMVVAVRQADERQRRFLADASHQLRNPLAGLRLGVENLAPHVADDEGRVVLAEAVEEADAMGRMLEALLAAARTGAVPPQPVALDDVLVAAAPRWAERAREHGLVLGPVPTGTAAVVVEPAGGLAAVLDELVDNASRLSGGTRVEVRVDGGGPDVVVHVVDDGRGLDERQRERAIERFWRAPEHTDVAGTGLGLAVCAELLAVAGGSLVLRPAPGGGLDAAAALRRADAPAGP